ncbi:MAG TPA: hypothetical protein DDW65_14950 [Firmicutes bacterium]|jgi:L-rhamnose-H+ transport protein|nr:hypothetical protein [Bacillota bacterium]
MTSSIALGLTFGVLSGFLSGSYGIGMKKIKVWHWENTWIVYSFWALLFFPGILAIITIPKLGSLLATIPLLTIIPVFLFGVGWGISNIGFGISLRELGMALTSVIVIGIASALGTILPLIIYHPESIWKPVGLCISSGALLSVIGIIMCSLAKAPEAEIKSSPLPTKVSRNKGILICIASGFLGILLNFALIAGKALDKQAVLSGASPQNATNATWFVALSGSFFVSAIYCILLLIKNRSFTFYRNGNSLINCAYTSLMGLVWFGGITLYGISVLSFGQYGPSIGWPIFQSVQIIAANLLGIATGEWNNLSRNTFYLRIAGIAVLILGIIVISLAGNLT